MPNYRRAHAPGGMFFFTLVTEGRAPIFTDPFARQHLRKALADCRNRWPFRIDAIVLLPDHLHTNWSLPRADTAYSRRWAWIKNEFTKAWVADGGAEAAVSDSRQRNRRRGVWQRRFWEHCIKDEDDLERHFDDLQCNPVKHGLVLAAKDWPYSSFHRFVKLGTYSVDWGRSNESQSFQMRPIEGAGESCGKVYQQS